jgi:hypothetical protein
MLPVRVCCESSLSVICGGWGASGRAPPWAVELGLSCAQAVEGVNWENSETRAATRNGFDQRTTLNNVMGYAIF